VRQLPGFVLVLLLALESGHSVHDDEDEEE
jgi:hypothetical protein